jgi:hypothetical protein
MGLEKEPVGARRGGGIEQRRDEPAQTAARAVGALPGLLHRVRGVEDRGRGAGGAETGEAAHVDDQVAIPEEGAALGDRDFGRAAPAHLFDRARHLLRRHPLALLDVHRASALAGGDQEIGLAAQEGGDLQDVGHLGGGGHLRDLMHVGEHREAAGRPDALERAQAGVESGAAGGGQSGPVRLVERRLVDDVQAGACPQGDQRLGHVEVQRIGFDHAGPRDEERGRAVAELGHR